MLPLALVMTVQASARSFFIAGAALSAFSITSGVLAPLRGRLVDRRGTSGLVGLTVLYAIALVLIVVAGDLRAPSWVLVLLAGLAGSLASPVSAYSRRVLAVVFREEADAQAAFAIDGVLGQLVVILGPVVVAGLLAWSSAEVALIVTAAIIVVGTLGVSSASPRMEADRAQVAALTDKIDRPRLVIALSSLAGLGIALGVLGVAIPALADAMGNASASGLLFAALSLGSVVGGLGYGARRWGGTPAGRYSYAAALFGAVLGTLTLGSPLLYVAFLLLFAGVFLEPALVTLNVLIGQLAPSGRATEVFAFVTTANNGGIAVGALVAGALVQQDHLSFAFGVASFAAFIAATVAALGLVLPARNARRRPQTAC